MRNRASQFAAALQKNIRADHPHATFPVSGVTFDANGDGTKFCVDDSTSVGLPWRQSPAGCCQRVIIVGRRVPSRRRHCWHHDAATCDGQDSGFACFGMMMF
jgi:hypothetical protein